MAPDALWQALETKRPRCVSRLTFRSLELAWYRLAEISSPIDVAELAGGAAAAARESEARDDGAGARWWLAIAAAFQSLAADPTSARDSWARAQRFGFTSEVRA
jgi:hypothetical protein